MLIDMGHMQTTVVITEITASGPILLASGHDANLGALSFDDKLFHHFATIAQTKYQSQVL